MTGNLSINGTEMRISLRGDEVLLDLDRAGDLALIRSRLEGHG